jgi:hypothetical protein
MALTDGAASYGSRVFVHELLSALHAARGRMPGCVGSTALITLMHAAQGCSTCKLG